MLTALMKGRIRALRVIPAKAIEVLDILQNIIGFRSLVINSPSFGVKVAFPGRILLFWFVIPFSSAAFWLTES